MPDVLGETSIDSQEEFVLWNVLYSLGPFGLWYHLNPSFLCLVLVDIISW